MCGVMMGIAVSALQIAAARDTVTALIGQWVAKPHAE